MCLFVIFKFPKYIPQVIGLNIFMAIVESLYRGKIVNALFGIAVLVLILNTKWDETNPNKLIPFLVLYSIWNVWFVNLFTEIPYLYSATCIVPDIIGLIVLYGNSPEHTLWYWALIRACILLSTTSQETFEFIVKHHLMNK